jgi:iron complex transport system ATP-binding protein
MGLMSLIETEGVVFDYAERSVLKDVSLSIDRGEIVSLLGPNGSGKTTLLKVLLGLLRPQRGSVRFEGKCVSRMSRRELATVMAYVPQTHRIGFAYRVLDVVLMGRTAHKAFFSPYSKNDVAVALQALERLTILHLKNRYYNELSGGERQLTLIARSLAQGARTLIMDEPTNGLDYGNQLRLLHQISDLAKDGFTFVKSTHAPDRALWIASRVLMIKEGSIIADGKPADVIDGAAIRRLYNTQVDVYSINGGLRICVPQTVSRKSECLSIH